MIAPNKAFGGLQEPMSRDPHESLMTIPNYFFDASAIVKLATAEPGSLKTRQLLVDCLFAHTSWVLIAEALNVLKRKQLNKDLTSTEYREAVCTLSGYMRGHHLEPIDILVRDGKAQLMTNESDVFGNVQRFPELDVADTLQLTAIRDGFLSYGLGENRTHLVTADRRLMRAAESIGIPVIMVNEDD